MRVLLVNDDGPPAPHSPHILGLYEELRRQNPTWDIRVVLPSSQKSWGSMAFTLSPACSAWYYYPKRGNYDGTSEETSASWSATRRPIGEDEVGEWIMVDGSPTTCANIGLFSLHSLQPSLPPLDGEASSASAATAPTEGSSGAAAAAAAAKPAFDLVISGPNFGRNSGTAFSLCSGTIGAALAASLSGVRAIALSYAHFHQSNAVVRAAEAKRAQAIDERRPRPANGAEHVWGHLPPSAPEEVVRRAHALSCTLIEKLLDEWETTVGVYTVNVPLSWHLMEREASVFWTRTWDSQFGPLFALDQSEKAKLTTKQASGEEDRRQQQQQQQQQQPMPHGAPAPSLALRFAPDMAAMLQPTRAEDRSTETDIWAILHGHISVARLSPSYTAVTPAVHGVPGSHFKL